MPCSTLIIIVFLGYEVVHKTVKWILVTEVGESCSCRVGEALTDQTLVQMIQICAIGLLGQTLVL